MFLKGRGEAAAPVRKAAVLEEGDEACDIVRFRQRDEAEEMKEASRRCRW
jgi:hypothetical protein